MMANEYRNIAQISPSATAGTDLYTCPASTNAIVSTIVICNQNATNQTVRVSVRSGTAASGAGTASLGTAGSPSTSAYVLYNTIVYANSTLTLTLGITLTAEEVVTVYASATGISFLLFGSLVT